MLPNLRFQVLSQSCHFYCPQGPSTPNAVVPSTKVPHEQPSAGWIPAYIDSCTALGIGWDFEAGGWARHPVSPLWCWGMVQASQGESTQNTQAKDSDCYSGCATDADMSTDAKGNRIQSKRFASPPGKWSTSRLPFE